MHQSAKLKSTSKKTKRLVRDAAQAQSGGERQISGLARVVRSNAQAGLGVALWHERHLHSSAERVIIPTQPHWRTIAQQTAALIETMFVYPERMLANLQSTRGLVFSGQLLLDLVEAGVSREDAYRLVQRHAMRAWKEDLDFALVLEDPNTPDACRERRSSAQLI
jgi:adenylosuccinate lyase